MRRVFFLGHGILGQARPESLIPNASEPSCNCIGNLEGGDGAPDSRKTGTDADHPLYHFSTELSDTGRNRKIRPPYPTSYFHCNSATSRHSAARDNMATAEF